MWFDSGRLCLDLVGTFGPPEELRDGAELRMWLTGAGLVPYGTPLAGVDEGWLPPFRDLRADLRVLVRAELAGSVPEDTALARVNSAAAGPPPGLCAVRDGDGHLVRALRGGVERGALLAAVARDAVELLTDPGDRALLRTCEGDGCTRVYLDTSRGHRRRWCSSEICGNRERVARHRRRALAARVG
ncbi:CGNR zinc finger domain-containing protein [Streptomyces sp. NPDC089799]|uniref:CGNR zinc finger domain-containing protein n=1 Tax=Streptomyces sp. NPDC089799 TaxID=3155066 RepID=UPI003437DB91